MKLWGLLFVMISTLPIQAMDIELADIECSLEATQKLRNLILRSNQYAADNITSLVQEEHADPNAYVCIKEYDVVNMLELVIRKTIDSSHLLVPLIKSGADVNAQYKGNGTALHTAARLLNLDAVRILLQHGAEVNAMADCRRTPLYAAIKTNAKKDKKEVVELLLQSGALTNISGGPEKEVPLISATYCDHTLMPLLILYKADIKDSSLLQHATNKRKEKLLEYGANPYAPYLHLPRLGSESFRQEACISRSCRDLYRDWKKRWAPMQKVFSEFKYRAMCGSKLQFTMLDKEGKVIVADRLLPALPLKIIGHIWEQIVPWTIDNQCDLEKKKWLKDQFIKMVMTLDIIDLYSKVKKLCKQEKEKFPGKHILGTSAYAWVLKHTDVQVEALGEGHKSS